MACPNCNEPAEGGQLVCLNCGIRLALRQSEAVVERRGFDNLPAVLILLAVVVLGAGAFGFALSELTDDSGGEVSAADRQPSPSAGSGAAQTETEATTQPRSRSLLLEWPAGVTAHTVVLMTTGDRAAAGRVARDAARSGLEAGLLDSDRYDLGTDLWIVFAGRFDNHASAERQAANLADRYPGAYATLVRPTG